MLRSLCDALHHPRQIAAEMAHGLATLGVELNLTGPHAVNHVPVEGTDERLVVVGDVLVEPVEGGGRPTATRYGDSGTGFIGQLAAGRVIQAVEQGTERTVRPGKVGGTADDNGVDLVEFVVNGVVELIIHAAATGFQAAAATDAALNSFGSQLDDFGFRTSGAKSLCDHAEGVECVARCVRAAVDEKCFHSCEGSTIRLRSQEKSLQNTLRVVS